MSLILYNRDVPRLRSQKFLISLVVFFLAFGYRLWGLKGTGALWDENAYFSAGFHYYYNLMHLQFDPDRDWGWIFEHPPVGKYIYGLGTLISYKFPDDPAFAPKLNFTFGRLESAVLGALTCVLIFLAGQEFFSTSVGLLSAVTLSFLPIFAAYGRIIGLESPQAFFWTGAVYFFLRAVLKGGNNRQYLMAGLWASLAFATKYNSGLLLLLFGIILLAGKILRVNDDSPKFIPRNFLLIPVMMAVFLYVTFPWLWRDPLNQFWKSFSFSKQHVGFADYSPLYYLKYFLATTPAVVIALASIPLINLVSFWRKREIFLRLALLLATLLPLSLSLFGFKGAGVRYVIFAFPSLSLLAGLGGVNLLSGISKGIAFSFRQFRLALAFLVILVSSYLIWQAALVHPYEVDYYSELVGGTLGAGNKNLGFGWRGEGSKELIDYVNQQLPDGSRVKIIIDTEGYPPVSGRLKVVSRDRVADYIVCLPPQIDEIKGNPALETVYTVKVASVANLGEIYFDPDAAGKN